MTEDTERFEEMTDRGYYLYTASFWQQYAALAYKKIDLLRSELADDYRADSRTCHAMDAQRMRAGTAADYLLMADAAALILTQQKQIRMLTANCKDFNEAGLQALRERDAAVKELETQRAAELRGWFRTLSRERYCHCEDPSIRCDVHGCRCVSCGLGEDVLHKHRAGKEAQS